MHEIQNGIAAALQSYALARVHTLTFGLKIFYLKRFHFSANLITLSSTLILTLNLFIALSATFSLLAMGRMKKKENPPK